MKHYEEVLKILHDKFDWKLTDSLTTTGKKLVADTIKALKISENNQNLQLQQTGVSSSDFRIVEYKDHFRIQKRTFVDTWFYFLWFYPLFINGKKEEWNTILKNKTFLGIRNWIETENYQFKTKEECLEWISDYSKYPIYHYC